MTDFAPKTTLKSFMICVVTTIIVASTSSVNANNILCLNNSWSIVKGNWTISANCMLQNIDSAAGNIVWFGDANGLIPDTYYSLDHRFTMSCIFKLNSNSGYDAGIIFRASQQSDVNDQGSNYYVGLNTKSNIVVFGEQSSSWNLLKSFPKSINYNTVYNLTVIASYSIYNIYINDTLVMKNIYAPNLETGSIGLRTYYATSTYYSLTYESHSVKYHNRTWNTLKSFLPRPADQVAVGYFDGIIHLIGGAPNTKQRVEYNISSATIIDYGISAISHEIQGRAQFWTQINHTIFMIQGKNRLATFDMKSKTFTESYNNLIIPTIHNPYWHKWYGYACLTSYNNYLFIPGGAKADGWTINMVQVLDIMSNTWLQNVSNMTYTHHAHTCLVHPLTKELFVMGGWGQYIEKMFVGHDISSQNWQTVGNLMYDSNGWQYIRAVVDNSYILVFGSMQVIQVIDVLSGSISSGGRLQINIKSTTPINVNNVIYVFGGDLNPDNHNGVDTLQYGVLEEKRPWRIHKDYSNIEITFIGRHEIWYDDFQHGTSGWWLWGEHEGSTLVQDQVSYGDNNKQYHGPLDKPMNFNYEFERNWLQRNIICTQNSDVYVSYSFAFCNMDSINNVLILYEIDSTSDIANTYSLESNNFDGDLSNIDSGIISAVISKSSVGLGPVCDGWNSWKYKTKYRVYAGTTNKNIPFLVSFMVQSRWLQNTLIYDIQIECNGHETSQPTLDPTLDPTALPTINPTITPTIEPTLEPTVNPTGNPTIEPTINPTRNPTIEPTVIPTKSPIIDVTSDSSDHRTSTSVMSTTLTLVTGGIIIFVVIICVIVIIFYCKKSTKSPLYTKPIRNPICLFLAIGSYEEEPHDPEFEGYVPDLDYVDIDIKNLVSLFRDKLGYHVVPKYNEDPITNQIIPKLDWTLNEIITLLREQAAELARNLSSNDANKYDGLIAIVSGHGLAHHLITSDYKLIEKEVLHRQFTQYYPISREVPRIIIYDCCAGSDDRKGLKKKQHLVKTHTTKDIGKAYKVEDISVPNLEEKDRSRSVPVWHGNDENPDYNLATIYSSNLGFQSKMNRNNGSYLIDLFVNKIRSGLQTKDSNQLFLRDICSEIQNELKHKQLPVFTFNNNTEYITFIPNDVEPSIDENEALLEVGVDGTAESLPKTNPKTRKNDYNALPSDEKENDRTDNMSIEMTEINNNGYTSIQQRMEDNQECPSNHVTEKDGETQHLHRIDEISLNNALEFVDNEMDEHILDITIHETEFQTSTAL
eukprot:327787_1